ncbi:methylenetetrahydrofolate reductase [Bradyrhizobium sp. NP1]|uniref:methylenetetrahydrofolate reductase n=1 Tax=Bradyrhizobium sp. NP1 TaxID=3049772 RepID=UPI0025A5AF64|nr:methylenetetrahydrofolate reductase [Bradyrhizobium sp. NP1]WJR79182.1 methylenetetrahydrofolate reductase [Bradyrhizobium sp. NP1]
MTLESRAQQESMSNSAASLMRVFSTEVVRPNQRELDALGDILPRTTQIFVASPPGHPYSRLVETARLVHRAGFEPIPHVAARSYESLEALDDFIARICGEAGVRRVLVIGGDVDRPAGPFPEANAVIESDLLQHHGIQEVAVSAYPDGHPKLSDESLTIALRRKLKSLAERNLRAKIVSQFCFEADRIAAWVKSLRMADINVPISVGLAGPTSIRKLARFALMCGVRNSFKAALAGKARSLLGETSPGQIIRHLGMVYDPSMLGQISIHFFSYGGLLRTAKWATEFQARFADGRSPGMRARVDKGSRDFARVSEPRQ